MRTLLLLIPFLAIPFMLPGYSSGLRLLAVLTIAASAMRFLAPQSLINYNQKDKLSPFHIVLIIGIFLLYFTIANAWYRHMVWPVSAMGVLLVISLKDDKTPVFAGLIISSILFWMVSFYFPDPSWLFPINNFASLITHIYPPSTLTLDSGIKLPCAITSAVSQTGVFLLQMATAITTVIITAFTFSGIGRKLKGIQWLFPVAWVLLLCPLISRDLYFLSGLITIIFFLFTCNPRNFTNRCYFFPVLHIVLCLLGYLGLFDRLAALAHQSFDLFEYILPVQTSISMIGGISQEALFFNESKFGVDYFIPSAIAIGLLLMVVEAGFSRRRDDLRYPTGVSLLIFAGLFIGPSVHIWLVHPLTWIAMACIQNATHRTDDESEDETEESPMPVIKSVRWATAGITGLLVLTIIWNLYPNWRTEKAIYQFDAVIESDNSQKLANAFYYTPYRSDAAALYATDSIIKLFKQGALPASPEPEKLESLLSIAAQHGFVSTLGYARLSGLFFLHSELDRSIYILEHAVKENPDELLLHEILADSLSTVGRQEEAITHYQMCANLDSSALRIRQKMAQAYQSLGMLKEAKSEIKHMLILDPTRSASMQ